MVKLLALKIAAKVMARLADAAHRHPLTVGVLLGMGAALVLAGMVVLGVMLFS
jgi:hypothetical protein